MSPVFGSRGRMESWITMRPESWPGEWAIGCWVCNARKETITSLACTSMPVLVGFHMLCLPLTVVCVCVPRSCSYARIAVSSLHMMSTAAFNLHAKSKGHQQSLQLLTSADTAPEGGNAIATGISQGVPRIDKFRLAATVVGRRDTFKEWLSNCCCHRWHVSCCVLRSCKNLICCEDFKAYMECLGQGDFSERVCKQMVTSMAHVVHEQDLCVLEKAGGSRC